MPTEVKLKFSAKNKTQKTFAAVRGGLNGVAAKLTGVHARIATLVGVGGFGALVAISSKTIDSQAKTADKLAITTEKLGELHHITSLYTSASAPAMNEALAKASKRLGEFNATGSGAAAQWLKELNLDTEHLASLSPDQLFNTYAESIRGLNDRGSQLAAISALMGDKSRDLIGIIDAMPESLAASAREAELLGLTFNRIDAAKVEAANDAMTRASGITKGLGQRFAIELAPFIDAVSTELVEAAIDAGGFGNIASKAIDAVITAVGFLGDAFRGLQVIWAGIKTLWLNTVSTVLNGIDKMQKGVIGFINILPGVDVQPFEKISALAAEVEGNFLDAQVALYDLVGEPLPSDNFRAWSDEVRATAQAAAEEVGKARKAALAPAAPASEEGEDGEGSGKLSHVLSEAEFEVEFMRAEEQFAALESLYQTNQSHFTGIWKEGLDQRQKFQQMAGAAQVKQVSADFMAIIKGATQSNKTLFKINKIAAIANAVVSTAEGVTKSLAAYPYPINLAMAAGSLAAGLAQISTIKSTQFDSGGAVSSVAGAGGSVPRVPDTATPVADQQLGSQAVPVREVNLTVQPGVYDAQAMRDFAEALVNEVPEMNLNLTFG